MSTRAMAVAALAVATLMLAAQTVNGQWFRGVGEMLYSDVCSDYMYRFRMAVTPKTTIVYAFLGATSQLAAFQYTRADRGVVPPTWATDVIPGANVSQPVLNVDTATDRVYFVHPVHGKIVCYDASTNLTTPVWVSDVVCTDPTDPRDQLHQTFAANGSRLLARCNDTILLLDEAGRAVKTFTGDAVAAFVNHADPAAPLAIYSNFTKFITWAAVPDDGVSTPPSKLAIWDLAVRSARPSKPSAVIPLPDGASPAGVNAESPWLLAVPDAGAPVLHLISSANGRPQASFDFGPLVNADGSLANVTVVPSPVVANRTVYGMVQGVLPSPFPWLPSFPDKWVWWMFALNVTAPKAPAITWITSVQASRGKLANQVPLVRGAGVFMTDYMQNATRSFRLENGTTFYNVPGNPYSMSTSTTYSIIKGTYKMSLPYVSPDGLYLMIQYDDWQYDQATPSQRKDMAVGNIRTMKGDPNPLTGSGGGFGFGR